MHPRAAAAVVLGLLLALVAPDYAHAATTDVLEADMKYTPAVVTVSQGDAVRWTFQGTVQHDTDSNQGFWVSDLMKGGKTYTHLSTFLNAGTYGYFCSIHPEMGGRVRVPMEASGSSGKGWTLRWSSASTTPVNRSFDVQVKRPGSDSWRAFRTDTSVRSAFFNPSANGKYRFRSRLDNRSNGLSSGWSPVRVVAIS